jgi:hypothetical protein
MLGGTEGGGQTQERPSPSGCGLHGSESTDGHRWNTLTCRCESDGVGRWLVVDYPAV